MPDYPFDPDADYPDDDEDDDGDEGELTEEEIEEAVAYAAEHGWHVYLLQTKMAPVAT